VWLFPSPVSRSRDGITHPTIDTGLGRPHPDAIELARLIRYGKDRIEVDESCRLELDLGRRAAFRIAVCHLGAPAPHPSLPGVSLLARSLHWRRGLRILVDQVDMDRAPVLDVTKDPDYLSLFGPAPGVADFAVPPDLVYLVFHAATPPPVHTLNALSRYMDDERHIGTVLVESAARCADGIGPVIESIVKAVGGTLKTIDTSHPLGRMPHWFDAWPQGAALNRPYIRLLDRAPGGSVAPERMTRPARQSELIVSDNRYGWLWNGEQDSGVPTQAHEREAFRFGENLLAFASRKALYE
jgi:hypothetical protein